MAEKSSSKEAEIGSRPVTEPNGESGAGALTGGAPGPDGAAAHGPRGSAVIENHPLASTFGALKDHPAWPAVLAAMEENRRRDIQELIDAEEAAVKAEAPAG